MKHKTNILIKLEEDQDIMKGLITIQDVFLKFSEDGILNIVTSVE